MAVQISGTTVIDNSRNLTNIASIFSCTGIASQAEAEAGTSSTKLMTPLRVAQAISALQGSVINNIQRGVVQPFTNFNSGTTATVTITSVNTSKAMCHHTGQTASLQTGVSRTNNYEDQYMCAVTLSTSTTVQFERISGTTSNGNSYKVGYEVVEFV